MTMPNHDPVTIKKYANRRLYNTATSSYVTLDHLADMVKRGQEFNVYDAKTGEDITRSVLTQIIFEEEGKGGQQLLPIQFLRQLIRFYGDSMQALVPGYLNLSMDSFSRNHERIRDQVQSAFGLARSSKPAKTSIAARPRQTAPNRRPKARATKRSPTSRRSSKRCAASWTTWSASKADVPAGDFDEALSAVRRSLALESLNPTHTRRNAAGLHRRPLPVGRRTHAGR